MQLRSNVSFDYTRKTVMKKAIELLLTVLMGQIVATSEADFHKIYGG